MHWLSWFLALGVRTSLVAGISPSRFFDCLHWKLLILIQIVKEFAVHICSRVVFFLNSVCVFSFCGGRGHSVTMSELDEVGILNSMAIFSAVSEHPTLKEFLSADINIPFHSTYVSDPETSLQFQYDIDGVVIELKHARGILGFIHYLHLPDIRPGQLKDCWHYIKKHIDLTRCSPAGIQALKNSVGYEIGTVEGGWHALLTFLPSTTVDPDHRLLNKECYRSQTL